MITDVFVRHLENAFKKLCDDFRHKKSDAYKNAIETSRCSLTCFGTNAARLTS